MTGPDSDPRDAETLRTLGLLGRLVGSMAHDTKNILQIVIGHAELLRRRVPDDPRLKAGVEEILKAAERGASDAAALLERARANLRHDPVQLPAVVRAVLAGLEAPRSIAIRAGLDTAVPDVSGDPLALQQVVGELVRNAIEAMPAGGAVEIEVAPAPADSGLKVLLRVTDTGSGMSPEQLDRLRDRGRGRGRGKGIGLAVVQRIVLDHGGRVEIESVPDKGTTVRCYM